MSGLITNTVDPTFLTLSGHRLCLATFETTERSSLLPRPCERLLVDDFVGECEQRRWHLKVQRPGRLQIDD